MLFRLDLFDIQMRGSKTAILKIMSPKLSKNQLLDIYAILMRDTLYQRIDVEVWHWRKDRYKKSTQNGKCLSVGRSPDIYFTSFSNPVVTHKDHDMWIISKCQTLTLLLLRSRSSLRMLHNQLTNLCWKVLKVYAFGLRLWYFTWNLKASSEYSNSSSRLDDVHSLIIWFWDNKPRI